MSEPTIREIEQADPFQPHDLGCRCYPHVSQQAAIEGAVQAATAEYRAARPSDDPPTGFMPGMRFGTGGNNLATLDARAPLDVERLARARHRWMHPTYRTFSRCDCQHQAALLVEADELLASENAARLEPGEGET